MSDFDAEIHLRLLGERMLDDPGLERHHHRSPLEVPARALVFAGALAAEKATRVVDDYSAAACIRVGDRGLRRLGRSTRRGRGGRLTPRRTMVIDHELEFAGGHLHLRDIAVRADGATVRYHWRRDALSSRRGGFARHPVGFPWGKEPLEIVDPAGNRPAISAGSGGGNDDHWDGLLELRGPVAADAAWLQVDGVRIDLDRRTTRWEAHVEALDALDPVERFLWRHLAVGEMPFHQTTDLEPALEALIAAGTVRSGAVLLTRLRAVAARMPRHRHRPPGQTSVSTRGLPEPWRSLLRRLGHDDGPARTLVVGAVAPPCDGFQLAVHSLTSDLTGFEIEFEVTPNALMDPAVDELPVAWWARDDRGNRYLGDPHGWSSGDGSAAGTMRYWPSLDPRATRLELLMCVDANQAVVAVQLCRDAEPGR